ncbi:MAG TPA: 16S rRNA (cytosine(1402)-N(4))-methyltransferase RsmH [Stellaceae bacterium]|nr:16S rRNA (cytosine(1402)-N(4))-methyltransferase RsmH [Stellaceae bacterium]
MSAQASAVVSAHQPVLLAETIAALAPRDGAVYVDGTFGRGGYTRALLAAARCRVFAIDRDPAAIEAGTALARDAADRLTLIEGRFGDMVRLLGERGIAAVAGIALDLGPSSPQLDEAARGFSFRADGPLDMRMERQGATAADLVNTLSEAALADIIFLYGEERFARRIARAILAARAEQPIVRTAELAAIVRGVVPRAGGIDAATRTFQALRISVNDELGELERGLAAAERLLEPGGRLAVVSFHSLEDRRVKEFLRRRGTATPQGSRHRPAAPFGPAPSFRLLTRKPIRPGEGELRRNPRARSARLRAAERTAAPPWLSSDAPGADLPAARRIA